MGRMSRVLIRRSVPVKYFNHCRILYIFERFTSNTKYAVHLLPDVDEQIKENAMNHRHHPGRRNVSCVTLPEKLISAVEKHTAQYGLNKIFLEEVQKLNLQLKSRLPPLEQVEYGIKREKLFTKATESRLDLTKEQVDAINEKINRQLKCEVCRWKPIDYSEHMCKVYLMARLAANYAVAYSIFSEIKHSLPSFTPKTFFDFGSGVGSTTRAAYDMWPKEIKEYFCVDASPDMNNLAEALLRDSEEETPFKTLFFRQFLPASNTIKYDLVTSAFSLLDLPSAKERKRVIDILWQKTSDILVVVEHGSCAGYRLVMEARDHILNSEKQKIALDPSYKSNAYVVAPCPHDEPCPKMIPGKQRSCKFQVVYNSILPQKQAGAKAEFYSYVVMRRGQRETDGESLPRIVGHNKKSRHTHCTLCCKDGRLHEMVFSKFKNGRDLYWCARMSSTGDVLPVSLSTITASEECSQLEENESDSNT